MFEHQVHNLKSIRDKKNAIFVCIFALEYSMIKQLEINFHKVMFHNAKTYIGESLIL